MQRLIKDASKMTDIQKDLNLTVKEGDMSFGNIVNAISVMQSKLDIAGTTAKEAGTTIAGSINSAKSAWQNMVTGLADPDADIPTLMENLVKSIIGDGTDLNKGVIGNLVPAIEMAGQTLYEIVMETLAEFTPKAVDFLVNMVNKIALEIPSLLQTILPVVVSGIVSLLNGISQVMPTLMTSLINSIAMALDAIIENLPAILNSGINIIIQLAEGITNAIPMLAEKLPQIINTIVQTLTNPDMLTRIINASLNLILALADGLVTALPSLISALPQIILTIVSVLTSPEMINHLGQTAFTLVETLTLGLIKSIPSLLKGIGQLGVAIAQGFAGFLVGIPSIGLNMIKGLWQGIKDAKQWLLDKIAGLGKSILSSIKGVLGIHSPSTEFAWIGKMSGEGYVEGLDDMSSDIQDQLNTSFGLSPNVVANAGMNFSPAVNTTVVVNSETDPLGQLVNNVKTFSNGAKNDYNYGM